MDFRRVFLTYVEASNSILVKNKKSSNFIKLPLFAHVGPIAVWGPLGCCYMTPLPRIPELQRDSAFKGMIASLGLQAGALSVLDSVFAR